MKTSTFSGLEDLLRFPFQDTDWKKKLLIASAVVFISVMIPLIIPLVFLMGYNERIARRIILDDGELYLPEWGDWGELFAGGFRLSAAGFLFSLPSIVLSVGGYGLMMAPALIAERAPAYSFQTMLAGTVAGMFVFGLSMVLGLVIGLFSPVALMHIVAKGEFSAAFRVREWWQVLRANVAGFAVTCLIVLGIS